MATGICGRTARGSPVTDETLRDLARHAGGSGDVPSEQTRMVYAVNRSTAAVLEKLSRAPRIGELGLRFSAGLGRNNRPQEGILRDRTGARPASWDDVILQGPHLFVATPLYKTPNKTMLTTQDWSATDFEALAPTPSRSPPTSPPATATATTAPTPTGATRTTPSPPGTTTASPGVHGGEHG